MTSVSTRITKLESTIRTKARTEFAAAVSVDFEDAIARAASNDVIRDKLETARKDLIRDGTKKAEEAALERFLNERAPEASLICYSQPQLIRLDANGKRLAEDDSTEHIAVLIPRWTPTHDLLIDARKPTPIDAVGTGGEKAAEAATKIQLFDEPLRLLTDKEWEPCIDRTKRDPAVHPYFAKTSPTDRWYPTGTVHLNTDGKPSGSVWAVYLNDGDVSDIHSSYDGCVRGGRLVPASQF